jgi:2-oxoglutarate ferredoxin oxidoreductase subunit alpha
MMTPGMSGGTFVATGLEHDEAGAPNYTPENRERMMRKRYRKLETLTAELEANGNGVCDSAEGAEIGVIGWGSTEGPIREAIARAKAEGVNVAHLQPKVLVPLSPAKVGTFLKPLKKVLVVEENHTAQFSHYLKSHFRFDPIEVTKCSGLPFSGDEVFAALQEQF